MKLRSRLRKLTWLVPVAVFAVSGLGGKGCCGSKPPPPPPPPPTTPTDACWVGPNCQDPSANSQKAPSKPATPSTSATAASAGASVGDSAPSAMPTKLLDARIRFYLDLSDSLTAKGWDWLSCPETIMKLFSDDDPPNLSFVSFAGTPMKTLGARNSKGCAPWAMDPAQKLRTPAQEAVRAAATGIASGDLGIAVLAFDGVVDADSGDRGNATRDFVDSVMKHVEGQGVLIVVSLVFDFRYYYVMAASGYAELARDLSTRIASAESGKNPAIAFEISPGLGPSLEITGTPDENPALSPCCQTATSATAVRRQLKTDVLGGSSRGATSKASFAVTDQRRAGLVQLTDLSGSTEPFYIQTNACVLQRDAEGDAAVGNKGSIAIKGMRAGEPMSVQFAGGSGSIPIKNVKSTGTPASESLKKCVRAPQKLGMAVYESEAETMLRSWYGDVVPNKMNLAMGWYNAVTGRDSAGRVVSPEGVSCLEGSNYFPYFRVMRNSMNSNRDGKDTATPPCLEQLAKSEGGDIRQARFKPPDKCLSSGGTWRDFVNQIAAAAKLRSYSAKYNYKSPVDQKDHTGWRIGGVMTLIDILARQFDSNAVKADSPLSSIEFGVGCGGK